MEAVRRYRRKVKQNLARGDRYASLRNLNRRDHYKKVSIANNPRLLFKRYRCLNKKIDLKYLDQNFSKIDNDGEKFIDIDAIKKEFRGKTQEETDSVRYKAAENLLAIEKLSNLNGYEFVLPDNHYDFVEARTENDAHIFEVATDNFGADNTFMIHDKKLYHNDYRQVLPSEKIHPLEIIYTKRCNPSDFKLLR